MSIILASSSPYRAELLKRLLVEFTTEAPGIDESPLAGETGEHLARRLARKKALKVAARHPKNIVIGCDQVAILRQHDGNSVNLGKPGGFENAARQLAMCSSCQVDFFVACCLLNGITGQQTEFEDCYSVHYKALSTDAIEHYLHRDQPYDCAGSIRTESLGAELLEAQRGPDPCTLIGLPVIALAKVLESNGVSVI